MTTILRIVLGILLFCLSIQDYKYSSISLVSIIPGIVLAVLINLYMDNYSFSFMILGAFSGLIIILCSRLTDSIGIGDGLVLFVTGIAVGLYSNLVIMMIAFLVASLCIFICFPWKASRKSIPFIPFITIGYVITSFLLVQ